ncbi:MAG: hypothetical protein U5R46_04680 [Gammaproteobacteria bacterium]|nr:hypothetical protein [Gammaproteobacteria bacterium]
MYGTASERASADLALRFAGLMKRFSLEPYADELFTLLDRCYGKPGRHFHNLAHIRRCIDRLDEVHDLLDDPDAAEIALWFHDAIHDPERDDNELRSALLFEERAGIYLPAQRAESIHSMIMATVHCGASGAGNDARYTADIDLSGLAAPWPEFLQAAEMLHRECGHATGSDFQIGSERFFRRLLSGPGIYLTEHFRTRCEVRARRNIETWLSRGQRNTDSTST